MPHYGVITNGLLGYRYGMPTGRTTFESKITLQTCKPSVSTLLRPFKILNLCYCLLNKNTQHTHTIF